MFEECVAVSVCLSLSLSLSLRVYVCDKCCAIQSNPFEQNSREELPHQLTHISFPLWLIRKPIVCSQFKD